MITFRRSLAICALAVAPLLMHTSRSGQAAAQEGRTPPRPDVQLIHSIRGPDLYRAYCASCHGVEARGNGPAAPALKARVPDLTLIAQHNNGVFPADRVSKMISGEETPIAHGSSEMPIWGPVFHQVEADQDWGNVRLQNLEKYLESIQKK